MHPCSSDIKDQNSIPGNNLMTVLSTLLIVWSMCTAIFVGMVIYRGHLTRHEIGEVFLNENVAQDRELEHVEIGRRID